MQREEILDNVLCLLENQGIAGLSMARIAGCTHYTEETLKKFWPDKDALLYDALRYHAHQIDAWRQRRLLDDQLSNEQKLLFRYQVLTDNLKKGRFPGCLFIAACSFYPDPEHPIHQLAEQQKLASLRYTCQILQQMEADDANMVAQQMELILEGCLSKLLVKRQEQDIETAKRLAQDILSIAKCRLNGALS